LGRYTQVGLFPGPVTLDLNQVVLKQLRFQGSMCHTWETWDRTLRLLGRETFDLRPLISNSLPLRRWEEGFQNVINRRGTKYLLVPGK
jgi:threonine dehydrogenase-like Zn-dependent dehydrogenase